MAPEERGGGRGGEGEGRNNSGDDEMAEDEMRSVCLPFTGGRGLGTVNQHHTGLELYHYNGYTHVHSYWGSPWMDHQTVLLGSASGRRMSW